MFTPISIDIQNFQSHIDTTYDFATGQATMVYGINKQDEGSNSNGSGKSALIKALAVCLLDTYDSDFTKDDVIRDGESDCTIRTVLQNPLMKIKLEIERKIFRKKSTRLFIWENNVENTNITSVKEGNQYILDLIGISKEDLVNYFFIDNSNSGSFFLATDSQQKKVISRFVNLSSLDVALEKIKNKGKILESELGELQNEELIVGESIVNLQSVIDYELTGRKDNLKEKKDELKESLAEVKVSIQGLKDKILVVIDKKKQLVDRKKQLNDPTAKIKRVTERQKKDEKKLAGTRVTLEELSDFLSDLRIKISDSITCPNCQHEFSLADPDLDLKKAKKSIEESEEDLEKLKEIQVSLKEKVQKYKTKERRLRDELQGFNEIDDDIKNIENKAKSIKDKIKYKHSFISELNEQINKFEELEVDKKRVAELSKDMDNKEKNLKRINKDLKNKQEEMIQNKTLIQVFAKDFRNYLIRQTLSVIEGRVNANLQRFNTNLEVRINGYMTNKSGDVNDKIDVLVSRDGENWAKFKRHSGGQKQRINVCGILALHQLINNNVSPRGLDFLSLDEIFEGLDYLGQKEIIEIFKKADATSMIISHNANSFATDNEVFVIYDNSVSTLQDSDLENILI